MRLVCACFNRSTDHGMPMCYLDTRTKMIYFRNILEARLKHTHKGHCQACGRLQAHESTGGVAKHGYTTEGGYFHGTCMGSGHKPLEHSHELCDRIQHDLHKDAEHH